MDSRCNVGTKLRNQVAVPMVRPGTYHQGAGQGTRSRVPETGQTAHCGTCGSSRAGIDDGRAAWMCSCLK